jgi:hypothetical protein
LHPGAVEAQEKRLKARNPGKRFWTEPDAFDELALELPLAEAEIAREPGDSRPSGRAEDARDGIPHAWLGRPRTLEERGKAVMRQGRRWSAARAAGSCR